MGAGADKIASIDGGMLCRWAERQNITSTVSLELSENGDRSYKKLCESPRIAPF